MNRSGFIFASLAALFVPATAWSQDEKPDSFFDADFVKPSKQPQLKPAMPQDVPPYQLPPGTEPAASGRSEPAPRPQPHPEAQTPPKPVAARPVGSDAAQPKSNPSDADGIMQHTEQIMQQLKSIQGAGTETPQSEPAPQPVPSAPPEPQQPQQRTPKLRVQDYLGSREVQQPVAPASVQGPIRGPFFIEAYVAGEPKEHLLSMLRKLVRLKQSGVRVGQVSVVMSASLFDSILDAMQDQSMSQILNSLEGGSFMLTPVTEIPSELGAENSPVWIVSAGGRRHLLEGYESIESMFQSDGTFTPPEGL